MIITFRKLFATVAVSVFVAASATAQDVPITNLVAGNNAFAFDLYSRLGAGDGNVFFSPYSISTCLAMTYAGARGDTASQMAHALHFDSDSSQLARTFADLQKHLQVVQQETGIQLNVANGIWTQEDHKLEGRFTGLVRHQYEAELKQVNFKKSADAIRLHINDWVSGKTKGKILDLLQPGTLNAQTRLVLVNAIYFKGAWVQPFKKLSTSDAPFNVSASQKVTAHFMRQDSYFKYAEPAGLQLLEMPYGSPNSGAGTNGQLAMDILLPREADDLKKLESSLNATALSEWLGQATQQKINVLLPKFTTTAQFSLGDTLAAMGMPLAFSEQADFSGMDGQRDLCISAVIHKAYVNVDEEGTEAAAATAAVMALTSAIHKPSPVFRADHPFIFLIRDTQSGAILFLGRVTDPTK